MPWPLWSYDPGYYPPFPKVEVELRRVDELKQVSYLAYLDSGSDGTVIPYELWRKMELSPFIYGFADVSSLGGPVERRPLYSILLRIKGFEDFTFATVDCREDLHEILLGRDVLNSYRITLDGKRLEVEVSDP